MYKDSYPKKRHNCKVLWIVEGIAQGGLQNMLSANHSTMPNMGLISPPTWKIVTLMHEDMEDQVSYLAMDLVDVVMCGNQV